ncbi:MAG: hypothetical protein C4541_12130 [Candidatus Auribacter fodinae]|jgi:hypothetical protein|uniref:Squalene cyclase C-terminal domain-containing protein n=1 Tax=Candidatus Auribacter fodinae TaxID=2093366 RepID=A0A3A4QV20_9BACT|nr:MAG: hypothetical protein C4541_12130 [Candidatus Auribacter fodinae]
MRESLYQWIIQQQRKNGFAFTAHHAEPDLLSTCFAVLALQTINKLQETKCTEALKQYILNHQIKNGTFIDERIFKTAPASQQEYLAHQATDFALMALQALRAETELKYPLLFLQPFHSDKFLIQWFNSLNWNSIWGISNNIMFVLNFLFFEQRCFDTDNRSYISLIFDELDKRQDPQTGYWIQNDKRNLLFEMAGAYHFYIHYVFADRPIAYMDKIIDSTLMLISDDGLFHPQGGGGACEDLDAIDILVKLSCLNPYRYEDIKTALTRAHQRIYENRNPDGGFCWAKRDPFSALKLLAIPLKWNASLDIGTQLDFKKRILLNQIRQLTGTTSSWKYSCCEGLQTSISTSDMWSAWFRPLALALIEWRYPELYPDCCSKWQLRSNPGLGWNMSERGIE